MFIVSAPSGAGKTSLTRQVMARIPALVPSVSVTTREMRSGEEQGKDYWFFPKVLFQRTLDAGHFLEHAEVFDYHYATPSPAFQNCLRRNFVKAQEGYSVFLADFDRLLQEIKGSESLDIDHTKIGALGAIFPQDDLIFDVNWRGAQALKAQYPHTSVSIFIMPPDKETLRARLLARAREGADIIEARLAKAWEDVSRWQDYDYIVVNRDFQEACRDLKSIILSQRLKMRHQSPHVHPLVQGFSLALP